MKRFLATLALTCVFSTSASAGSIPTCGVVEPPAPGEVPTTGVTGNIPSTDFTGDMPTCGLSVWLTILDLAF